MDQKEWSVCDLDNDYSSLVNLIYVGMTGKFKRVNEDEVAFNSGSFEKRNSRWTIFGIDSNL